MHVLVIDVTRAMALDQPWHPNWHYLPYKTNIHYVPQEPGYTVAIADSRCTHGRFNQPITGVRSSSLRALALLEMMMARQPSCLRLHNIALLYVILCVSTPQDEGWKTEESSCRNHTAACIHHMQRARLQSEHGGICLHQGISKTQTSSAAARADCKPTTAAALEPCGTERPAAAAAGVLHRRHEAGPLQPFTAPVDHQVCGAHCCVV